MMHILNSSLVDLADALYASGVVEFGAFTLKEHERNPQAPLSPHRFNLRLSSHPNSGPVTHELLHAIAVAFVRLMRERELPFDRLVGIPQAGTPIAQYVARLVGKPQVFLLKEMIAGKRLVNGIDFRSLGAWSWGEPKLWPNERVLLLDDVLTGADSKIEAIRVLETVSFHVRDIIVVVDREQGGRLQVWHRMHCRVHALFLASDLFRYYRWRRFISDATFKRSMSYLSRFAFSS